MATKEFSVDMGERNTCTECGQRHCICAARKKDKSIDYMPQCPHCGNGNTIYLKDARNQGYKDFGCAHCGKDFNQGE